MSKNTLYYGDNLDVLRLHIPSESVDLVYLDPPFNSNQNYNVLFSEQDGSRSAAQIKAFGDTWHWDQASAAAYEAVVEGGGQVSRALQAFRTILGDSNMLAYLAMMAPRLVELHRVIKPTGSLYLHCDPTASHYLRVLLDAIFDPRNFRSEIIWRRSASHNKVTRQYGPIHDTILFYAKSARAYFQPGTRPPMRGYIRDWFTGEDEQGPYRTNMLTGPGRRTGASGQPWRHFDPTTKGRHWAIPASVRPYLPSEATDWTPQQTLDFLHEAGVVYIPREGEGQPKYKQYVGEGIPYQDLWAYQPYTQGAVYETEEGIDEDVKWIEHDKENQGYPTQKPLGLLERIINSSCPPEGTVLDPFCGCGTAVVAAQSLNRPWMGIDITHLAIGLIKNRLLGMFGDEVIRTYDVKGEPATVEDATRLAVEDPFQFQAWALGLVGARTAESNKKGADKGIDGRLYFHDQPGGKTKQVVFSVKAGKLHAPYVRDLRGVIERERAQLGGLLSLDVPTSQMRSEAASAGFYESPWGKHPRLQLLTVGEMLTGRRLDMPPIGQVNATYRRAERVAEQFETLALPNL